MFTLKDSVCTRCGGWCLQSQHLKDRQDEPHEFQGGEGSIERCVRERQGQRERDGERRKEKGR